MPQQSKGTQLPLISSKIEGKKEYCYCVVQRIEVKKAAMAAALDLSFLKKFDNVRCFFNEEDDEV